TANCPRSKVILFPRKSLSIFAPIFSPRGNNQKDQRYMTRVEKDMNRRLQILNLILVWLLLTLSVFAQTRSDEGQITGVVKDPAQALVPGSQVTLTNQQTDATATALTDDQGAYRFPSLPPGMYIVKAEARGFQANVSLPVKLDAGQTVKFDFSLT